MGIHNHIRIHTATDTSLIISCTIHCSISQDLASAGPNTWSAFLSRINILTLRRPVYTIQILTLMSPKPRRFWAAGSFVSLDFNVKLISYYFYSCDELLKQSGKALSYIQEWLGGVRRGRLNIWVSHQQNKIIWEERMDGLHKLRDRLSRTLAKFRSENRSVSNQLCVKVPSTLFCRHAVLEPYLPAFDRRLDETDPAQESPSHRYLFHCYVYQYHLIQLSGIAIEMV